MRRMIAAVSVCLAVATLSGTANAETQAERDARRSGYISGFSCSLVSQGQAMTVRFLQGGTGRIEWQEDDVALSWSLKKDKFCVQVQGGEKNCSNMGGQSSANEEAEFKEELAKSCL